MNSLQGAKNYWICWGFVFLFQNRGRSSICTAWLKIFPISICMELSKGMKPDSKFSGRECVWENRNDGRASSLVGCSYMRQVNSIEGEEAWSADVY